MPPESETREIRGTPSSVNRMTPSRFHVPPVATEARQSVTGEPPSSPTFFNLPLAKNPTKRLSGDQKGSDAPSVPSTGFASSPARERSHSWTWLPVAAVKASHLPSGDNAMSPKLVFFGGSSDAFTMRGRSGVPRRV